MVMTKFLLGTTLKFTAVFYNWDGTLIDPSEITFTIYDYAFQVVGEAHPVTSLNRVSLGNYFWLWVPAVGDTGTFIYEWKGIINGTPSIRRDTFMVANV
jgi:hypothetical protein